MKARICANPNCHAIQPGAKCHLCKTTTRDIPPIPLHAIGVDGTIHLDHRENDGYSIIVLTSSVSHRAHIPISNLLHSAQLHLPLLGPASGLTIMDAIKNICSLIKTKNTCFWAGWVIYLLEVLQDHADPGAFRGVLKSLRQDLDTCFIEHSEIPPVHDAIELHEVDFHEDTDSPTRKSA